MAKSDTWKAQESSPQSLPPLGRNLGASPLCLPLGLGVWTPGVLGKGGGVSDAHTVLTRAWAGPHGITWRLETGNVPERWRPFLPRKERGGGDEGASGGGITELLLFLSHLPDLSPTLSPNPSL